MPFIRLLQSKYYAKTVVLILISGVLMSFYSYYTKKSYYLL